MVGDFLLALVSNYLIDLDFMLFDCCPGLQLAGKLVIVHGHHDPRDIKDAVASLPPGRCGDGGGGGIMWPASPPGGCKSWVWGGPSCGQPPCSGLDHVHVPSMTHGVAGSPAG